MIYPITAITSKTLCKFHYDSYNAISVNMLKYNNDSSLVFRLLDSAIGVSKEVMTDLNYQISFSMKGLEFINIDRLNGFYYPAIPGFKITDNISNKLIGYSIYTNKEYELKNIDRQSDFIRHSLPCDSFFSGVEETELQEDIVLPPYQKIKVDKKINRSTVSIRPLTGFNEISREDYEVPITIVVYGIDTFNNVIEEEIEVTSFIDIESTKEYEYIDSLMVIGSSMTVTITLFPYIPGEIVIGDVNDGDYLVRRDNFDHYISVMTVDVNKKLLVFNRLRESDSEYPYQYERFKTVPIDIDEPDFKIINYYIDRPNRLLYIIGGKQNAKGDFDTRFLLCYNLIIPVSYSSLPDTNRTENTAISIEYEENCIDEVFDIWVYPVSKTNDVDSLNIFVNGDIYEEDLILDLIRYDIDTNRFTIPFSKLFPNGEDTAIVVFDVYGDNPSRNTIILDRTKLKYLYKKDLNNIPKIATAPPGNKSDWALPAYSSSNKKYQPSYALGYGIGKYGGETEDVVPKKSGYGGTVDINETKSYYMLYKLSISGNIIINDQKIINVFDAVCFDENSRLAITSQTITHIKGRD